METKIVLALDGGGMKGYLSLELLKHFPSGFMENVDLVCGTSTGGLISYALSTGGFTINDLQDQYVDIGPKIFNFEKLRLNVEEDGALGSTEELEKGIKHLLSQKQVPDGNGAGMKTFVVTSVSKLHKPIKKIKASIIRNYNITDFHPDTQSNSVKYSSAQLKINVLEDSVKACRATSMIPMVFSSLKDENYHYFDGGFLHNCPASLAYSEARKLWPKDKIIIISIGTGYHIEEREFHLDFLKKLSDSFPEEHHSGIFKAIYKLHSMDHIHFPLLVLENILKLSKRAIEVLTMYIEYIHKTTNQQFNRFKEDYKIDSNLVPFRFDCPTLEKIQLWDTSPKSREDMKSAVDNYIKTNDFKDQIDHLQKLVPILKPHQESQPSAHLTNQTKSEQ